MKDKFKFIVAAVAVSLSMSGLALASIVVGPGFQEPGYTAVYELAIPAPANFSSGGGGVPYALNIPGSIPNGSFPRIGYYLELQQGAGPLQWISISMAAFATQASKIGVPNDTSGEFYHYGAGGNMPVGWDGNAKANIFSNVGGITTGTGINTINLEFWPSNYGGNNDYNVPGSPNNGLYDFGDGGANTGNGYGSMQIHNYGVGQTLFALNQWNGGNVDLGIGNRPTNDPDWTFASNGSSYSIRNLQILVYTGVPEPSTFMLIALGGLGILGWIKRSRNSSPSV